MDSIFSTEKTVLATVHTTGYLQMVDLDLTVHFNKQRYFVALRAIPRDAIPRYLTIASSSPLAVLAFVIAHATARTMTHDVGLPALCVGVIRDTLEKDFGPHLQAWLRKTQNILTTPCAAIRSVATERKEHATGYTALVTVDRDVSSIFGRAEKTFLLEYTLFCESQTMRGVIAAHHGSNVKTIKFNETTVDATIRRLNSDALALETALAFNNNPSRHHVRMISAVLKLCLAMNTHQALIPPSSPIVAA